MLVTHVLPGQQRHWVHFLLALMPSLAKPFWSSQALYGRPPHLLIGVKVFLPLALLCALLLLRPPPGGPRISY